mgnify:CR=1 FL=1
MRQFWHLLLVPVGALSIIAGSADYYPLALTPKIETSSSESPLLTVKSIPELYQMRDRLRAQLQQPTTPTTANKTSTPIALLPTLRAVEIRIEVEETAKKRWNEALQFADQARELESRLNPSVELLKKIPTVWQQGITSLQAVPQNSFLAKSARQKVQEYKKYLAIAFSNFNSARAGFLEPIVRRTGIQPENVRITVCDVLGECRHWYGDQPPESAASLIKVPIAIALMQKLTQENISLDTKIKVSQGNYTEDTSDISVGGEYTLRQLVMRMINQSSNIATNQLIDYLGRDYINSVLRDRGYQVTQVNSKLAGKSTYPANMGTGFNRITTDELTQMMLQIYNLEHPGDEVLREALASQDDKTLGYEALKNTVIWIGEKTGRNSKVLGTTLAMSINNQDYVLSIVFNYSDNERAIRKCINDIASYIADQAQF